MKISTRTRYGIRLMINLAKNYGKGFSLLKDISKKEGVSEKYLSLIVIPLKGAGLLNTTRGVHGGYRLSKPPSEIKVKDIVEVLEGDLFLIDCVKNSRLCKRSNECVSRDLWVNLSNEITNYLTSITLMDLLKWEEKKSKSSAIDYCI
ncbi:MAG: Rrf2 family transcriptional regulator [Actinobacteria bacterium]|nr:Rrf2 family transcriptional regulator [Actinomycetota bacterium]